MRRYEPAWLLFASDAAMLALWGAGLLMVAALAAFMERRRHNRDRIGAPDRVGWVPWTGVFLLCGMLGVGLIAATLPALLGSRP